MPLVSAPTGQISMQAPHSSHSRWSPCVGGDFGNHAAIDHAQRAHAHAFVADAHAAEAQDAARRIEKHHRRKLFLGRVDLLFGVAAFAGAVAEHHVLQFALAAFVAHRAIQRMVGEQEFQGVFARLGHLRGFGAHHHALGHRQRAGGHHLGHLFHFHQAHAAGGLQREALVIAERRDLDAGRLGGVDHQGSGGGLDGRPSIVSFTRSGIQNRFDGRGSAS